MYYSSGAWNRPHNSHAMLLDKYWIKLQMGTMTRDELKKVNAFKVALWLPKRNLRNGII